MYLRTLEMYLEIYELDPAESIMQNIYAKANNKYMKDYDKNKELPSLQYYEVNIFYGRAMLQKLPINNFEWIKDTSQSNEYFIKHYNEESYEGIFFFFKLILMENYMNFIMIYRFYLTEGKLKK